MKYKITHGYKVNDSKILLLEKGSKIHNGDKPLQLAEVIIPESLIKEWYEELMLGINDNWEEQ